MGEIQIGIGILAILLAIIGGPLTIKYVYIDGIVHSAEKTTATWTAYKESLNTQEYTSNPKQTGDIVPQVTGDLITITDNYRTTFPIFVLGCIILLFGGIYLVTQGVLKVHG